MFYVHSCQVSINIILSKTRALNVASRVRCHPTIKYFQTGFHTFNLAIIRWWKYFLSSSVKYIQKSFYPVQEQS